MTDVLDAVALALRLPVPPRPPPGGEGTARAFHPAAGYLRLRMLRWTLTQVSAAIGLLFAFGWHLVPPIAAAIDAVHLGPLTLTGVLESRVFQVIEIVGLVSFLVQLPVTYLLVRLDYETRWYLLTDRSLRIREGVTTVREQTMTFANVQNIAVRQGPLQRAVKISDLEVSCAGGGDRGDDDDKDGGKLHVACFRGVADAAAIRDLVLAHLRVLRSTGTGDPDDQEAVAGGAGPARDDRLAAAIERLVGEARALRRAMAAPEAGP